METDALAGRSAAPFLLRRLFLEYQLKGKEEVEGWCVFRARVYG
jgi:hypothetical protein